MDTKKRAMCAGLPRRAVEASVPCNWAQVFAAGQGTLPRGVAAWAEKLLLFLWAAGFGEA